MKEQGFFEFQTPILTASSPEGARDYLVPSRLHPGKFYALPQAPQQFKQLIMVSGFDRYFQIAPCFRDEDARADRSPGEFYQLDLEMSFVTQDDVFDAVEPVIRGVFEEFGEGKTVTPKFPRIPFSERSRKYGTDKPDLRNPIEMQDVIGNFSRLGLQDLRPHSREQREGRGLGDPGAKGRLACILRPDEFLGARRGPAGAWAISFSRWTMAQWLAAGPSPIISEPERTEILRAQARHCRWRRGIFRRRRAGEVLQTSPARRARKSAEDLDLIDKDRFDFCWIVDFPMYEWNEEEKKIDFSHNPFSMPNFRPTSFLRSMQRPRQDPRR